MDLNQQYQQMWTHALAKFRDDQFEVDGMIDSNTDTRYGLTLLARPSWQVKDNILHTLNKIKTAAPRQYYYPGSDVHLTILSIISCSPRFKIDEIDQTKYRNLIKTAVQTIQPFHIKFHGLTASPSSILIRGFPQDNALANIRNSLRDKFQSSHLQHSIDKRYKLQTAHLTVIRFKQPLLNAGAFIEKIRNNRNQDFGQCLIEELELVGNDWYQRKDKVQLLETIELQNV